MKCATLNCVNFIWHAWRVLCARAVWRLWRVSTWPSGNCNLNVKKLPKTWHFCQKNWQKLSFFSTKLPILAIFWHSNGNFLEGQLMTKFYIKVVLTWKRHVCPSQAVPEYIAVGVGWSHSWPNTSEQSAAPCSTHHKHLQLCLIMFLF